MQQKKSFLKYLLFLVKKLFFLCFGITVVHVIIIVLISKPLHLTVGVEVFVAMIPLISFLLYLLINIKKKFGDVLSQCKYNPYFPFYFKYDAGSEKYKNIKIKMIQHDINECDVLLRRHNRYIDGFIFSENSYFTHAGIYVNEYDGRSFQVLHSTGNDGVHAESLESFCKCDDVAILRFSFKKTDEEYEIYKHIIEQKEGTGNEKKIKQDEKFVFNSLMQGVKRQSFDNPNEAVDSEKEYHQVVIERAKTLIGTEYDFNFNFDNFDKLSCIEYVWYCFKCLFPLHRIRVKDFEFFLKFIKMPVIIPDVFIKNDYFAYVYSSIPGVNNKKRLIKHIKKGRWQLWTFVYMVFIWDAIFLFIFYLVKYFYNI